MVTNNLHRLIRRFLILIISGTAAVSSAPVTVVFRDSVMVSVPRIFVRDIATVRCDDQALRAKIEGVLVGDAAPAGYSRFVTTADLCTQIIPRSCMNVVISHQGSGRTKITTAAQSVKISDWNKEIETYVRSSLSWESRDVSISVTTNREFELLPGTITSTITGYVDPQARGAVPLKLTIASGSDRPIDIPVVCKVKVTTGVVVATEQVNTGVAVSLSDLKIERRDISSISSMPFTDINRVAGLRAQRTVLPGTVLTTVHVKTAPDVTKGDNVSIVTKNGSVTLTVAGIARQDGSIGQSIWIENCTSHRMVKAKITAPGIALVGDRT